MDEYYKLSGRRRRRNQRLTSFIESSNLSVATDSINKGTSDGGAVGSNETNSTPNKYYPCEKCGREYRTKYTRSRHERLECGIPAKYSCRMCNFRSKHKHNLKQHFESVHTNKRLPKEEMFFFNFSG